jgi:hypothetical protein
MTGTSARNYSFGIFKSKRAKSLAIKYSLDLYNKNAYIHNDYLVSYYDVKFIVDNLWIDYFFHGSDIPIDVSNEQLFDILNNLIISYPFINSSSEA